MSAPARGYAHADTPFAEELDRLHLLEGHYDAKTIRRLRMAGPLHGARCLEVGAGAGSIARFLAAEIGPAGQVVALDLDPRFLADLDATGNVEVRRHDITVDEVEFSAFDLVHCRALLLHLADPERALAAMAAALRPGGWLLVEDADYSSCRVATPDHPSAGVVDRLIRAFLTRLAGPEMDPWFGRRLPELVDALGLVERGDEALEPHRVGGGVAARLIAHTVDRTREQIVRTGVASPADIDAARAALADPTFVFIDSRNVAAWGRRPAPAFLG